METFKVLAVAVILCSSFPVVSQAVSRPAQQFSSKSTAGALVAAGPMAGGTVSAVAGLGPGAHGTPGAAGGTAVDAGPGALTGAGAGSLGTHANGCSGSDAECGWLRRGFGNAVCLKQERSSRQRHPDGLGSVFRG
jgi:hypothetical protein